MKYDGLLSKKKSYFLLATVIAAFSTSHAYAGDIVFEPQRQIDELRSMSAASGGDVSAMELTKRLGLQARQGDKVRTIDGMACFKFGENDYRCVKRNGISGRFAVILAAAVDGEEEKSVLERYCYTLARAWGDNRCGFNAELVVMKRGTDQTEETLFYLTDRMTLLPWSKY